MYLITTADERTWPNNQKNIFLGEWCKLYSRKHIWQKFEYDTLKYHWDDRDQYYKDYQSLSDIYEIYLSKIIIELNRIHKTEYSERYWRIIIGPWLRHFIDVIYDRYLSIKLSIKSGLVTSTLIMNSDFSKWIPDNFEHFHEILNTDQWNHMIYGEIIKIIDELEYINIDEDNIPDIDFNNDCSKKNNIKHKIVNIYTYLLNKQPNRILFSASYFGLTELIKLQFNLRQFPYLFDPKICLKDFRVDMVMRTQIKFDLKENDFFKIEAK